MKIYSKIFILLAAMAIISSCAKKEETLTPSNINLTYKLPQGNNAFDQTIVNYYKTYGSYMLYQFTERDAYWTPTGWKRPVLNDAAGSWSGIDVSPAETSAVEAQVDLINKSLFTLYPAAFLKKYLPAKLLLCNKVDSIYTTFVFTPTYVTNKNIKKIPAFYSYDNIYINYGNSTVAQLTAAEKLAFLARLNQVFFQSINERGMILPSVEFMNSADYASTNSTQAVAYSKGLIANSNNTITPTADWNAYVMAMVTLSEADLNRSVVNTDKSAAGILNATKDSNGIIKKRYAIVRNYFINNFQVDLQAIGNKARGL